MSVSELSVPASEPKVVRDPKPPRRPPRQPPPPLGRLQRALRAALTVLAGLLLAFTVNVTVLSQLQHAVAQQQLHNEFREELASGTAPVSEGDFNQVLLSDGVPVAQISIPEIGVDETIVEGTTSADTQKGPGHRRDTVLPGQAGVSVIMGRASAYGGPFASVQELVPGVKFTVLTGQGKSTYSIIGVRYAGDPSPAAPAAGQARLVLETARGPWFAPSGVAYVDAELIGTAKAAGPRLTTFAALPAESHEMATDTTTVWALVFALQFLVAVEIAALWTFRRIGLRKTWIVFVPLFSLAFLFVANQTTILLPNLL